jgi:hypothetical protein
MKWLISIRRHEECSDAGCAAHRVLCDKYTLLYITSFQKGFPRDLVDLVRASHINFRPRGWLPALVVTKGDLRLLQRLYKLLYNDQSAAYGDQSFLSFKDVWLDALRAGSIKMAAWVDTHAHIRSNHTAPLALRSAIASGRVDVIEWLLQRRPQYATEFTPDAIEDCPTVEVFRWLEATVRPLPRLTQLIDRAAGQGRLALVRYVFHHHGSESCSPRAMVGAASNGHLSVVHLLHRHAHDQCSSNAMRSTAYNGHLSVVKYLNEHCSAAHGDAFELAALAGHLEIVQYLVQTRTDVRVLRAYTLLTQSGRHQDIQDYLSAILNPVKQIPSYKGREGHKPSSSCGMQ